MKRVLLVDDDLVVLRMYQEALTELGFAVDVAQDGLQAIKAMRTQRPDVVVLDLMIPKFTGVDLLRYVRTQADLASLPVVVLANSYMNQMGMQAVKLGVQKALLKLRCSPSRLAEVLESVLEGRSASDDESLLLALPKPEEPPAPPRSLPAAPRMSAPAETRPPTVGAAPDPAFWTDEFITKVRREFLENAARTCSDIRALYQALVNSQDEVERYLRLQNLYRKIHFVTVTAGIAQRYRVALMAHAFEALLFELLHKPKAITASVTRTTAATVDFLDALLNQAPETSPDLPLTGRVLVVDDDPMSNRLTAIALKNAHLQARTTERPLDALQWLHEERYDLLLLDIEMPGMDGFELCRRIRLLPGYRSIPVVFVTSHSDFESRVKSVLSGGNDLIAKPVFPLELAVKAVLHLLQSCPPAG